MTILACFCGGVVEISVIGAFVGIVTIITEWYNRRKCAKHNCQHNCGK